MPRKPKQPCAYPGCPNLSDGRYCEQHRKLMERNYEQYSRDPAVHKKYGRAWKRIRDSYVKTHPFCERCFEQGILVPVEEVHHKSITFGYARLMTEKEKPPVLLRRYRR